MDAVFHASPLSITRLGASSSSSPSLLPSRLFAVQLGHQFTFSLIFPSKSRSPSASSATLTAKSSSPRSGVYTVGEFMTKKEDLHVVKPTTTVDEALEILVENRITGFPVIDEDWKLVGLVSDYDLLALDSISGSGRTENSMFPEVDSTWKTFNAVQRLLSKTNGKLVGDLMTPAPVVVEENTNLEDAAKILLETKYRRLPVVDSDGKLVGIITRGNVVRAALQIKRTGDWNA
ncbi:unnamed protein product [Microthlaspi erraticum]|uniref:CBS domain-containing protein n=1 Tax=Microthlaspi erraticum TaxID=1685480 RepID=A0A6D2JER4_9BRAS|nr:unnamed protein product [Microthlaspi erraticum]